MDAMKEALKRKMLEMKGAKGDAPMLSIEIGKDGDAGLHGQGDAAKSDDEKDESDLAPDLEKHPDAGQDQEQILQILAALADHDAGAGREANGLQERAAIGAKDKLAQLKGMKK